MLQLCFFVSLFLRFFVWLQSTQYISVHLSTSKSLSHKTLTRNLSDIFHLYGSKQGREVVAKCNPGIKKWKAHAVFTMIEMHVLEGEPVRSWGNRIESSTCIKTLRIDCIELFHVTQKLMKWTQSFEWKFFGSLPTPARPCQPQRGHWHWALLLPRLATLYPVYPSPMAASPGIYGAKIDVKGWQLEREVAMTQRWPNWRLATSKYTSCAGYPILSDVIRSYGMFWVAVSATHCKWILHSSQAGPRSPSVVHVSSWLTNPSCLIPGQGCTPQGRIVRVQEVEVKLIRPQRRGSHELLQVGQLQVSDCVLITLTLYTEANSSEYHRMISDNSETWHL